MTAAGRSTTSKTPAWARAPVSTATRYKVTPVEVICKEPLAKRAPASSPNRSPRLVLVTCQDYDPATGHYASNVLVTLNPA